MNTLILSCVAGLLAATASGADWPQWRGPFFNGSSDEKDVPAAWSKSENIAWSVELPGPAASTPVVSGDTIFVSSSDVTAQGLVAMAVDRKTGKVLWKHPVAEGLRRDDKSNYASPSSATDGKQAVFFYGNGDLIVFDFKGDKLWSRNIQKDFGEFAFQWTFSTSPVLYDGKLFLQVLQRDVPANGRGRRDGPNESYLLALDPSTGKTLWRVLRPCEAVGESREAFSTPVPFVHGGRKELLITGGDCVSGHDPESGRELWRWGTWNPQKIPHWRLVPSPVAGDGIVLACAPKSDPVYAVKAGGIGVLDDTHIAWKSTPRGAVSSDVPTPAFYRGDFVFLSDVRKTLSRIEPKSGKVKWSLELPGRAKFEASPTVVDGKVFMINFAGDVAVADVETGALLRVIPMGDERDDTIRSVIAVSHSQLFIRTNNRLFCVGR